MVFSSIPFLYYFLPLVVVSYFMVPFRMKNFVLLIFSLFFYSWGEPTYIFLMLISILLGYFEGLLIDNATTKKRAFYLLIGSCFIHLGFLGYFKYADFFIANLNSFGLSIPYLHVLLPIGISFYTFQIISYLIDVYRKDCVAQKNLISFGAYVSMFPQLIAGPIVRYKDIAIQLDDRTHSFEKAALGIRRFVIGLSKKVLFANTLGEFCQIFASSQDRSILYYWLYAIAFSLQIYYDFSGYSDMAIGLGQLFGFHFPENFQYPYTAESITMFWRKWHMTLGSWFRDYVYIPMGGNRVSTARWFFNVSVVWFLTGLWHGAAWNFILWGMFFAILLILEKTCFQSVLAKHKIFAHVYVILAVLVSFTIFNSQSLTETLDTLRILFTGGSLPLVSKEFLYYFDSYKLLLLIAIIGATPYPKQLVERIRQRTTWNRICNVLEPVLLLICFLVVTAYLINDSYNPFLYFRF